MKTWESNGLEKVDLKLKSIKKENLKLQTTTENTKDRWDHVLKSIMD